MRVLHVITGLAAGGAEHQLRLLVRRLPHDCEVVTLSNPGTVAEAIRADGTAVHELTMSSNHDVSVVGKLRKLMRDGRFDLVHTHLYRACVHGRVAARLAGVPNVIATEHSLGNGFIEARRTSAGVRGLYLASERLGQHTIAVSEAVAGRLRAWGVPDQRISMIPNGIDAAEFGYDPALRRAVRERLGIAPDALVVGGVGRLEPSKRFDRLIRAIREVPGTTLLLVGEGSARAALEREAAARGVRSRVVFTGAVGHTREALCAMDLFASPSEQETFGLAVLEALACGLPVVYAVCPPLDELAASGDTGDAPRARRLSRDWEALARTLRAELAARSERGGARLPVPGVVGHYDITRLAASVGQLYERVASRPRRRAAFPHPLVESKGTRW
jgi:glycosyltransferase involved in cell wall biosynthesis